MIAGEEIWIEQLESNQEYDEFFSKKSRRKIRDKLRNIGKRPLNILTPIIKKSPLATVVQKLNPKRPSPRPKSSTPVIVQQAVTADTLRQTSIAVREEELLQKIEEHEEQKVDDARELEVKEAAIVQTQIDTDYGNNKQSVAMGAIAFVCVVGLAAIIIYSKSKNRKNQVEALKLKLKAAKIPTP